MKLPFGFRLASDKAIEQSVENAVAKALAPPGGGGWNVIYDYVQGAFEQGLDPLTNTQMTQQACVYACVTLIANSIAKLPLNQIELKDGAWQKVPSQYDLLTRPSKIANRITWGGYLVSSMLTKGAAFGLKRYENRALRYIELLHPSTEVLVSEMGETFYRLSSNIYSHLPENQRTIPGQYIFHVPYNTLVHPLIGVPPLEAARAAALSGSAIMSKQARTHGTKPEIHGFLKVPATLTDAQATAAKAAWQASNGTEGTGVGVLRNGVEYQALQMTARDSESTTALTLANEDIARAFGVPKHLLGIGTIPSAANAEALMLGFYSQTLQPIAELIELALDEALELPPHIGVEFDVKALSRLDSQARSTSHQIDLNSGKISVNEARADDGLPPVAGGEVPRIQMQDVRIDTPIPEPKPEPEPEPEEIDEVDKTQLYQLTKETAQTAVEVKALQASLSKLNEDVSAAVAEPIAELKTLVKSLSDELQKQRAEFELRLKSADDARAEIEQKHEAEAKALREFAEASSASAGTLMEEVIALKAELTEARKSAEDIAELRASVSAVEAIGKALSESVEAHKADTAVLAKSLSELPEIPEIPAELTALPEVVKGLIADLSERVEAVAKMADGCMKFKGTWDDGEEYGIGATVAHKNAQWTAMRDKPGTPGDKDSGWKMCMKVNGNRLTTPYEHR